MFPVGVVGKIKASLRSGFKKKKKLECTGGGGGGSKNNKYIYLLKMGGGGESQSALFSPLGRWTGNDFLFEDGLILPARVPYVILSYHPLASLCE